MEKVYLDTKVTPLLSICIPTWNRAKFLSISLDSFLDQMKGINPEEVELFVSDNCSDDNTTEVVKSYIDKGLPITYNKNEENIGASRNFLRCMQRASGKYILLLGDDDILASGILKYLLGLLRDKDYGLVHFFNHAYVKEKVMEFDDIEAYLKQVSSWITFISANVFRKDIVGQVDDDKYLETRLLQVPYYVTSACRANRNLFVNSALVQPGLDEANSGYYNYFEIFVKEYLGIWVSFVDNGTISPKTYALIKREHLSPYLFNNISWLLIVRKRKSKLKIDNGWSIIMHYYGKEWYFYVDAIKYLARVAKMRFVSFVKKSIKRFKTSSVANDD